MANFLMRKVADWNLLSLNSLKKLNCELTGYPLSTLVFHDVIRVNTYPNHRNNVALIYVYKKVD
jgi:hypothetical protein